MRIQATFLATCLGFGLIISLLSVKIYKLSAPSPGPDLFDRSLPLETTLVWVKCFDKNKLYEESFKQKSSFSKKNKGSPKTANFQQRNFIFSGNPDLWWPRDFMTNQTSGWPLVIKNLNFDLKWLEKWKLTPDDEKFEIWTLKRKMKPKIWI